MTYEITLIEADIKDAMNGSMRLGLLYEGKQEAEMTYIWDAQEFKATFHGNAPSLPVPAHPTTLLQKPIEKLYKLKTDSHKLITEVFKDHQITISFEK